jgi:O-antigen/teichoic acid export membrane protein
MKNFIKKSNKHVINILIYSFGNVLPKAVTFLLMPLYTFYLSPEQFGIVNTIQAFSAFLIIIFTLEIERSVYRLIHDYKQDDDKKRFLGTLSISMFFISTLMLFVLINLKSILNDFSNDIPFNPYILYGILASYFYTFTLIPKIYFQSIHNAKKYFLLSFLQFLCDTLMVIFYVVYLKQGAIGMLKGILMGHIIVLPFFVYHTLKNIKIVFDLKIFQNTIKYSLPLIPSIIAAWIINLSDRFFIEYFFSLSEVGIYSLGVKIASVVQLVAGSFLMAYNPLFFQYANSEDQENAKKKLYISHNLNIVILLIVGFSIAFIGKDIIYLFMDVRYHNAYVFIPFLSLGYFFMQLIGFQNLAYYQSKKTKELMYIVLFSSFINILLNYFLIKNYSAFGATLATLFTQFIFFVIQFHFSKKYYFIPYNWKLIIPLSLLAITLVIINNTFWSVSLLFLCVKLLFIAIIFFYLMYKIKPYIFKNK